MCGIFRSSGLRAVKRASADALSSRLPEPPPFPHRLLRRECLRRTRFSGRRGAKKRARRKTTGSHMARIERLTLGVLVTGAGSSQTVLLTFLLTGIAGQQAGMLQGAAQGGIGLEQSTGNAEAHSFGLTGNAAAAHVDLDVVLFGELGEGKRLTDDHLQGLAGEILIHGTAVDFNLAGTGIKTGTGNSGLAAAGAVIKSAGHGWTPTSQKSAAWGPERREDVRRRRKSSVSSAWRGQDGSWAACREQPCGALLQAWRQAAFRG